MGDTVKVKGTTKSFAGNNMVNAQVAFEVTKRFHGYMNNKYINLSDVVQKNQIVTDEKGAFEILIPLQAFDSIPLSNKHQYYFGIDAVVTDLQGESHKAVHSFKASMQSINLSSYLSNLVKQSDSLQIHL